MFFQFSLSLSEASETADEQHPVLDLLCAMTLLLLPGLDWCDP
jgi:hypothetical protein